MAEQSEQPQDTPFQQALIELEKRGRVTQLGYQRLVEEYGYEVADDTLRSPKPRPTAEALTQLIETIPGVKVTPGMKLSLLKPINVIASHVAISATLLGSQSGLNEMETTVTFPKPPRNDALVNFGRTTDRDRLQIELRMTPEGQITKGVISSSEVDESQRRFSAHRGEVVFDANGNIEQISGDLANPGQGTSKIDIGKAVSFVQNGENFGKPIDLKKLFQQS